MEFKELGLHSKLQEAIENLKFVNCTPIQEQTIPPVLSGKDIAGLAQTGTGKTGAFLIPLINRVLHSMDDSKGEIPFPEWRPSQFVLVLVPTRELAEQVHENVNLFGSVGGIKSVAVYGGTSHEAQIKKIKEGVQFIVATPGRLIDLYKEHEIDLSQVRAIVFDEADRMFDMGFKDDMRFVLQRIPKNRQFLVYSATLNFDVLNVAYEFGADPVEVNVSKDEATAKNVKDEILHVGSVDKPQYLLSVLKKENPAQTIIFSNFKRNVERISTFLSSNGVPAVGISSLLTQAQRQRVMEQFKGDSNKNILVATDVAARGLDIMGVDLVLNYELPDDAENYVHRIGRTGRAGNEGQAISLVGESDVEALARIEDYVGKKLDAGWLEDADLVSEFKPFPRGEFSKGHRPSSGKPGGGKPRRPSSGGGYKGKDSRSHGDNRRPRPKREWDKEAKDSRDPKQTDENQKSPQHRDRKTGRHDGKSNSNSKRRHHNHKRSENRNNSYKKPYDKGPRADRPVVSKPVVQQSLGGKVKGFLKKLFN